MTSIPREVMEQLTKEAHPIAIRTTQDLIEIAKKKGDLQPAFAGMLCSLVLQNLIISITVDQFEPGSSEGEQFIEMLYANAILDAKIRWHQDDLKKHFGKNSRGH